MLPDAFSHDQAVKNLLKAYPAEALEFLAEDVVVAHGPSTDCEFLDTAVAKDDVAEPGPGQAMDLAIRYAFADGKSVVIVLVEHWSDAGKLDLLRTARYYLDLCRRFPDDEILPIALVDDVRPRELVDTIERGALGRAFFQFSTRIVQVPAMDLERFRTTCNRVALSFSPNMGGSFDRVEQVIHVALEFKRQLDLDGFRKFFAFWVVEGKLDINDQRRFDSRFKEMEMPEIIQWWIQEGLQEGRAKGLLQGLEEGRHEGLQAGRQEGLQAGRQEGRQEGREEGREEGARTRALQDARKMLEHGIAWAIVTDVTGVVPEDLA